MEAKIGNFGSEGQGQLIQQRQQILARKKNLRRWEEYNGDGKS
jgi:hypothetical protein